MLKEIFETVRALRNYTDGAPKSLTSYEVIDLAIRIQQNRILQDAFVTGTDQPSALEAIAMQLGAAKNGTTIKDALIALATKADDIT